jgi:hypothetical protein
VTPGNEFQISHLMKDVSAAYMYSELKPGHVVLLVFDYVLISGRDFWLTNGFWWEGYFDLTDGSDNMMAFQNYLAETGIDVSL